jgi:hypothetical protein
MMGPDERELLRSLRWVALVVFVALAVVLLAGCAKSPQAAPQVTEELEPVPPALQVCPEPALAPAPPPVPRTVEAVLAWGEKAAQAADANARALRNCHARLDRLNAWIGTRP